jgi:hypothetical protein
VKGVGDGVKEWVATPEAFPHGLAAFTNYTHWPVVGHNRFWSSDTVYARQNGGKFDFIVEADKQKAIPTTVDFWDYLFRSSKAWGLSVYEQDWLHNEWEGLDATLQSATLARDWLTQMGAAASKHGLSIQYCMAYPRFALASAEVHAVDQIRVTDDYAVDLQHTRSYEVNLYAGTSSMLAAARHATRATLCRIGASCAHVGYRPWGSPRRRTSSGASVTGTGFGFMASLSLTPRAPRPLLQVHSRPGGRAPQPQVPPTQAGTLSEGGRGAPRARSRGGDVHGRAGDARRRRRCE